MALILDAFAQPLAERLLKLAEDGISKILDVKDDLYDLRSKVGFLSRVLSDAESRKIREIAVKTWVTNLREILYDAEDLLDDCRLEGERLMSAATGEPQPKCCSLSPLSFFRDLPLKNEMGKRIRAVRSRLDKLDKEIIVLQLVQQQGAAAAAPQLQRPAAPLVADEDIVGIDEDAKLLVDLLIGGRKSKCPIFAVTGMPGIGKTTLAQKVFGDPQFKSRFDVPIWLQVTNSYSSVELLKEIGRYVKRKEEKDDILRAKTYNEAADVVRDLVDSKTLFIVLDDIWEARVWNDLKFPLSTVAHGSRVLVTTRNEKIAKELNAYLHKARELTEKEGWLMLSRQVFGDDRDEGEIRELEKTGIQIVQNCKGLPLAIKTIAGMLKTRERTKREWEAVRDSPTWSLDNLAEDVKPGLLLSYLDLPPQLKQCFVYCSLFPSGYRFHHQTIVQMWIAEGLVKPEESRALEETGDDWYKELVMRNLLQASPEYYEGRGSTMHDLVLSLAKHVSTGTGGASTKERHKFFVKEDSDTAPEIGERECVRTILISKYPKIKSLHPHYFNGLRHLRVLDLTHTGIKNLPDSLSELVQLRFLNLAFTRIRAIPESIGRLRNLETLKANDLKHMEELPKAITQLSNLRHLAVGSALKQLTSLPVGIGNLRKLRTLSGFVVNDGENNMKELRNLRDLAHVTMFRLEKVASEEEAQAAELEGMKNLNFLRLSCTRIARGQRMEEDELVRIQEVFEGLKPPKNLDALHIDGFSGLQLPGCIRNCSLRNLNWLRLDDCKFIEQLPPLGKLPHLKALQIWGAIAVSKIEPEFFSRGVFGSVGFPNLTEFYLKGMTKLKEIAAVEPGVLPRLKKLQVIRCPKLGSLPDGLENATKLTHLLIEDAENIKTISNLRAVTELKLNGNSKLKEISGLRSLNFLTISKCQALNKVDSPDELNYLSISDDTMQALPEWLTSITLLRRFTVKGNRDLVTRCTMNGLDWPKIVNFPHVDVRTNDGTSYITYRKDPFSFQSDLTGDNLDDPPPKSTFDAFDDEEYSAMSFRSPYEP